MVELILRPLHYNMQVNIQIIDVYNTLSLLETGGQQVLISTDFSLDFDSCQGSL